MKNHLDMMNMGKKKLPRKNNHTGGRRKKKTRKKRNNFFTILMIPVNHLMSILIKIQKTLYL